MENQIITELLKRPIAYQPVLAKAFGSVKLGIFWSQLYYWHDKGKDEEGWIYKTQAEIYEETGLSRKEQETARKLARQLGVIEEKLAGHPATVHFRLDQTKAVEIVQRYFDENQSGQLEILKKDWSRKKDKPTSSIAYVREVPAEDVAELAKKYQVDEKFILARAEDVVDYCEAKGKTYRNYKAALRNFIKTHLKDNPEEKKKILEQKEIQKKRAEIKELEKKMDRTPEEQERISKNLKRMKQELTSKLGWK